ncbi:MAG: hypothetical protein ABIO57_03650 [Candidatus Paceibacterota bacterium]
MKNTVIMLAIAVMATFCTSCTPQKGSIMYYKNLIKVLDEKEAEYLAHIDPVAADVIRANTNRDEDNSASVATYDAAVQKYKQVYNQQHGLLLEIKSISKEIKMAPKEDFSKFDENQATTILMATQIIDFKIPKE